MKNLIFLVGPPGAGKTTLLRQFISGTDASACESDDKKVAWVRSGPLLIFGRWQGYHKDGSSKIAGRLDGCDRLWNGTANLCVSTKLLEALLGDGVCLFSTIPCRCR